MNLSDEIRKQIEKNKGLKLAVGEINNHLSILEELARKDIMEQVDEAYQKGFEDGKAVHEKGCEGCEHECENKMTQTCILCCNAYKNRWIAKSDKIEVGDEVIYNGTTKCLVVRPETDERYAVLIDSNGNQHHADHSECKKTGRHFDIASILEDMRND